MSHRNRASARRSRILRRRLTLEQLEPRQMLTGDPTLVAHWTFDENAGTVAHDAAGADHAAISGGATWAPGRIGTALKVDAFTGGKAVAPDEPALRFVASQSYTLSAWVEADAYAYGWQGVVTKNRDDSNWYGIWILSGQWVAPTPSSMLMGSQVTPGWHHVALVQDGAAGTRSLYVDGVSVASGAAQDANGVGGLWVGGAGGVSEFFSGSVDDVRVYSRALDWSEVHELAAPPVIAPPVAPTGLTATAASSTAVDLIWTDHAFDESGFKILRSTDGINFTRVGLVDAESTTFQDTGLISGDTYYYRVVATNEVGDSTATNTARVRAQTIDGLVAEWRFGEGSGTVAHDSSGMNDATLLGGAVWTAAGPGVSGAVRFPAGAGGHLVVPDTTALRFGTSQSFTLSAWVSPDLTASGWQGVVTKARDNAGWYGIWLGDYHWWVGGSDGGNLIATAATAGWHHVALVQDGAAGTRAFYIDGVPVVSGPAREAGGLGDLWIGGAAGVGEFFTGSIGDVRVYSRALTGAELAGLTVAASAPTSLTATAVTGTQVNLVWVDNSNNEDGFLVERSTDGVTFSQIGRVGPNVTTYIDTGLTTGTTYTYRVRAVNVVGYSPYSSTASATAAASGDAEGDDVWAALGVTLTVGTEYRHQATIGDGLYPTRDVDLYRVQLTAGQYLSIQVEARNLDEGGRLSFLDTYLRLFDASGQEVASNNNAVNPRNGLASTDSALGFIVPVTGTYYVGVSSHGATAYDPAVRGSAAAADGVMDVGAYRLQLRLADSPPPSAPTLIDITPGPDRVDLAWVNDGDEPDAYTIERSTNGVNFSVVGTVAGNVTTYADTSVVPGEKYYYRVSAQRTSDASSSGYDGIVAATPRPANPQPALTAPASADTTTVQGTHTILHVRASMTGADSQLRYTWSIVSKPIGAAEPSITSNGTNEAKDAVVAFYRAGSYTFRATVAGGNGTVTSDVTVTVAQSISRIDVPYFGDWIANANNQPFQAQAWAKAFDQFGDELTSQPTFTWSLAPGSLGAITSAGAYSLQGGPGLDMTRHIGFGTATFVATAGGVSGSRTQNVGVGQAEQITVLLKDLDTGAPITDRFKVVTTTRESDSTYVNFQSPANMIQVALKSTYFANPYGSPSGPQPPYGATPARITVYLLDGTTHDIDVPYFTAWGIDGTVVNLNQFHDVVRLRLRSLDTANFSTDWNYLRFASDGPKLYIDSANQYGYSTNFPSDYATTPYNTPSVLVPSKFLTVNDIDTNNNGVPDFAEGFGPSESATTTTPGAKFVPVLFEIPPDVDLSRARFSFSYNGSDPARVQVVTGAGGDTYVPAPGLIRLWAKDGSLARDPAAVDMGGDYVTPGTYITPSALGMDDDHRTKTLWVEAVRPIMGALPESIQVSLDLGYDNPYNRVSHFSGAFVRTLRTRYIEMNEDGSIVPISAPTASTPSPIFSGVTISIVPGSLRASADKKQILADIQVSGQLTDAASDLMAGSDGRIDVVRLFVNDLDASVSSIPTVVTKATTGSNPLQPYKFSATFSTTLAGIAVKSGENVLRLSAKNAYGYSGFAETTTVVVATAPNEETEDGADFTGYTFSVGSASGVVSSMGGTFRPFFMEVEASPPVNVQSVKLGGTTYPIIDRIGDLRKFVNASDGVILPRPFLGVQTNETALPPAGATSVPSPTRRDGFLNFARGFGQGIYDTGVGIWDGIKTLGYLSWNYNFITVQFRVATGGPLILEQDQPTVYAGIASGVELAKLAYELFDNGIGAIDLLRSDRLQNGDLTDHDRQVIEYSYQLLKAVDDTVSGIDHYELGRIVGRVVGEVALAIESLGAYEALRVSVIPKAIARLKEVPYIRRFTPMMNRLEKIREAWLFAKATPICFIAGTPVLTDSGSKPIEEIRVGDLVLSRHEETGEVAYRPVVGTVTTNPARLYHVQFEETNGRRHEVVGTGEHPFYVVNHSEFVPANELQLGDALLLSTGGEARVTKILIEESPGPNRFTTYNFEVADFHTYFVGDPGVWVHNSGSLCDEITAALNLLRDEGKGVEEAFDILYDMYRPKLVDKVSNEYLLTREFGDMVDQLYKELRAGEIAPDARFWSSKSDRFWTQNMWEHWMKHKDELRKAVGVKNPFEWLDYLRNTTKKIDLEQLVKYDKWINYYGIERQVMKSPSTKYLIIDRIQFGVHERVYMNENFGLFMVQIRSGPEKGVFRTLFYRDESLKRRLDYLRKQ